MLRRLLVSSALLVFASGCDEAKRLMDKASAFANDEQAYSPVPGEPAPSFLEPVIAKTSANTEATLAALKVADADAKGATLTTDEPAPATVTPEAAAVLTGSQKAKTTFDSDSYKRDDESFFTKDPLGLTRRRSERTMASDAVVWSGSDEDFVVSVLDQMPVRYQGSRGTCASHAALGQIEGFVMKKFDGVEAINLAEQRFYWMSKPENWDSGGDPASGGSDPGTGFATSARIDYSEYGGPDSYPAEVKTDFNIPLESDCPYNEELGDTDLQTPQAAGCKGGVVKVKDFAAWMYQWEQWLETPQQIFDFLKTKDYPVVVYTKLSANWENNDGMITLAGAGGAGGATEHAAGHAYLIVGARKLSSNEYPGEGGMCFYVRNSWGTGWGVNGLACMTLAWFNEWRFPDGFAQVLDVSVDEAQITEAKEAAGTLPDDAEEPDPNTKGSDDAAIGTLGNKRGEAHVDRLVMDDPAEGVGTLIAGDNQPYKMKFKDDGATLAVRGIRRGGKTMTLDLSLPHDGAKVFRDVEGRGTVQLGEWDAKTSTLVLCGNAFASVCDLNYVSDWNELVVGLTEAEARREEPQEPFNWQSFGFGGYAVEVSVPEGFGSRVDLRFQTDGVYSNPQRFAIDPTEGLIKSQGQAVGSITDGAVCSGSYKDVCRVVLAGDAFHVLFKAKKKE